MGTPLHTAHPPTTPLEPIATARRHSPASLPCPAACQRWQLNRLAQRRRIAAGELDATRSVTAGVYRLCVGDRIVTRRNDRDLQTDRHISVHNRDEWTVTKLHRGGAVTATGHNGTIRLPAAYDADDADDVELGYAQTSPAAQGRTVNHSLLLVDGPVDQRGVYVPMTRGRTDNHVYVIADEIHTARDILESALSQDWIDRPAHQRRSELNPEPVAAIERRREPLASDDIRRLLETEHELAKRINAHDDAARRAPATIAAAEQAHSEAINRCDVVVANRDHAQESLDRYDRAFHRRDHTMDIVTAKRERGIAEWYLPRLRSAIAERARGIDHAARHARDIEREGLRRPQWQHQLAETRTAIRGDLEARERKAEHMPSLHAVAELEPRPRDPRGAKLWNQVAAQIDQHHTAYPRYQPDRESREPSRVQHQPRRPAALDRVARRGAAPRTRNRTPTPSRSAPTRCPVSVTTSSDATGHVRSVSAIRPA